MLFMSLSGVDCVEPCEVGRVNVLLPLPTIGHDRPLEPGISETVPSKS